jgi:hypothetical protein
VDFVVPAILLIAQPNNAFLCGAAELQYNYATKYTYYSCIDNSKALTCDDVAQFYLE